jgi:hypothetical protein
MIIALVLETVLFITRDVQAVGVNRKYKALLDPKRAALQQQKPTPTEEGVFQTSPACQPQNGNRRHVSEPKKQR